MVEQTLILDFSQIGMQMVPEVGGKNASLGEMFNHLRSEGIGVPDGFAITSAAYRRFLAHNGCDRELARILGSLDAAFNNLHEVGRRARNEILKGEWPPELRREILSAHARLLGRTSTRSTVAVRSSATAEDLPDASFAGQMESYLNIAGEEALLDACRRCFASLFTDRAIRYRADNGFDSLRVAVSVGVQQMVRSDLACAGVGFTLEPESGNTNVIVITGSWGLGENVVQGSVTPDQFTVFKAGLQAGKNAIVARQLGAKEKTMIYAAGKAETTVNTDTDAERRGRFILTEAEILKLARWSLRIEAHYGRPMDIEWAKDGASSELFIVQARPETVHAGARQKRAHRTYTLEKRGQVLVQGIAVGEQIAAGPARRLSSPSQADLLNPGEVLITGITNPDWDPIMKKAAAIVTDKGGRTSHAAIVARELGLTALVGTGNATAIIEDGRTVTVSCAEGETGYVYEGSLPFTVAETDWSHMVKPKTQAMLILGDPEKAFSLAEWPSDGIGLMRLEFIINNAIRIHPVALARWTELAEGPAKDEIRKLTAGYADKPAYFVDKLAEAVATIAAAFHPREVIVRMSDFKSNEYANLLGGRQFEPDEENPMLGFRGASRYTHPLYRDGFKLECAAMKKVRDEMGLTNVKLMIPFCRTVEEAAKVEAEMAANGLRRGENGLELYVMVEIPSNVLLMRDFAEHFDGFSIGSNDLTQLTLGLDRDSALVSPLFSERNPAVLELIARAIRTARQCGKKIGLCGQAPSDHADFARFLVGEGIHSISFNPDALFKGMENMVAAES